MREVALLERNGCHPRGSFYDTGEIEGWASNLGGIMPDGYCMSCGEDILYEVDWSCIQADWNDIYDISGKRGGHYEIGLCENCKKRINKQMFYVYSRNWDSSLDISFKDYINSIKCKTCGIEIIFNEDNNTIQRTEGLDLDIELYYCKKCKTQAYKVLEEKKKEQEERRRIANLCFHCKKRDWEHEHHITYEPARIIRVCRKCHSKIHNSVFPNPLWKQKKKDFEETKRKRREREREKNMKLYICNECGIEEFSPNKVLSCPSCNNRMEQIGQHISNFHCSKCLKSWAGLIFQDACPSCILNTEKRKINEKDKNILRINIRSIEDQETKEKFIKLYKKNTIRWKKF